MSVDSGDAPPPPPPPPPPPDYSTADQPVTDEGPAAPEDSSSVGVDTAAANGAGTLEGAASDLAPADVPMVDDGQAAPDLPDTADGPSTGDTVPQDSVVTDGSGDMAPGAEPDLPESADSANTSANLSADADVPAADVPDAPPDADTSDAGTPDADTSDAGTPDADTSDAGTPDADTGDVPQSEGGIPDWTYSPDMATQHGRESVEEHNGHGVSDDALNDAVQSPQTVEDDVDDLGRHATTFVGKDAVVILNDDGQVVTAWPTNRNGYRYP